MKYDKLALFAGGVLFGTAGTLTHATPRLERVIPFNGMDERECLRLAACLEEHFPHSMARAVVDAAQRQGIDHEERHSVVNYVVAHGISSSVDGTPVLIGSYHFIFEDEKCRIPEGKQELFDSLPDEYSHLYLASGGELIALGVLGILPPASSALLHNGSTILTGLKSMTPLLK